MTENRSEICPCGSEKEYKKCCFNWHENWAAGIERYECDQGIKDIIRGTYDYIVEHNYQGWLPYYFCNHAHSINGEGL